MAIGAALNHWTTDLYDQLSQGRFSNSARISTYLSTLSKFNIALQHIPGMANLPADYHPGSPMECSEQDFQVRKFVERSADIVVRKLTDDDNLSGRSKTAVPFTTSMEKHSTCLPCSS